MSEKLYLGLDDVDELAERLAAKINRLKWTRPSLTIYAVPRGGIPAAYLVKGILEKKYDQKIKLVANVDLADLVIDDLIDSGKTLEKFQLHQSEFYALIDKRDPASPYHKAWVVFPWEASAESSIEDNVIRVIQYVHPELPNPGHQVNSLLQHVKAWQL